MTSLRALLAATCFGLALVGSSGAVVIMDSTHEKNGFKLNEELAVSKPEYKAAFAVCNEAMWGCGFGSATWIGNHDGHGYLLAAAHGFADADREPESYTYRASDGRMYKAESFVTEPRYKDDGTNEMKRMGFDLVIIKLTEEVTGIGEAPTLYAGDTFIRNRLTFIGFGARGTGSRGVDSDMPHGDVPAAGGGIVVLDNDWDDREQATDEELDSSNFVGIFLPKEDGSVPCPNDAETCGTAHSAPDLNDPEIAADVATFGLVASGDSGAGAWIDRYDEKEQLRTYLAGVGVVSRGDRYGDMSFFARLSGDRRWITEQVPSVKWSSPDL